MDYTDSGSPIVEGRTSAPIVNQSWRKRVSSKDGRQSVVWALINLAIVLLLYSDMCFSIVVGQFKALQPMLWYIELTLCTVFMVNIGWDIFRYCSQYLLSTPVEVTLEQKRLLGVKDTDPGFTLSPMKPPSDHDSSTSLVFSPGTPSSQTAYSPSSSPWGSLGHVTPTNAGSFLGSSYSYASPGNSFITSPPGYQSQHISFERVPSLSSMSACSPSLAYSPGASISSLDSSLGLRSRLNMSGSFRSPSPSDKMTDLQSLSMYLREQEDKEYKASLNSSDLSFGNHSFSSFGRTSLDYNQIFSRKSQYQLASRSPQSLKSRHDVSDNMGEEVWRPLGVTEDDLYLWGERLRKWIGNTIMVALAREIKKVNALLRKQGCEDTEIGEVGVSTLKQLALTKGQYIPTLNVLVPYLDFCANQDYLVKRIKELGSDGCISEFSWASGGVHGKTWEEHLPTDASLVMHMFCTYLDSRLPPEIKFPDGKTFTCQYFIKTPDKPDLTKEDNMLLYQSDINPPHFQVVIKNTIYNLPKGRNNLFHAILLFLYHVKYKENGKLGRVNLGMSGVNLLSVLDP